jgi:hypothetical protein
LVLPGAARKFEELMAPSTSAAVMPREASRTGSIHTRME